MKLKPSKNSLPAREYLANCVMRSGAALLSDVPMAMTGQPTSVKPAYAFITVGAAALHIATDAAVWVVGVRL